MREFKFIRGIYKDEKIFNTDETDGTLFALYKNGEPVSLDIKNNETFQETIAGLEPDNREIYTVRPSQFKVTATKQNDGEYTVTYKLNEKTYDGSKAFPGKVKDAAENHLSENTTAHIPEKPSLILSGDGENATIVKFTFENKTSINKSLFFRVTGNMKTFTRTEAEGMGITAYKVIDNEVKYEDTKSGTFYKGKLQELVKPVRRDIAPDSIDVDDENFDELDVASSYTAKKGFWFVNNDERLTKTIQYNDPFNTKLYKEISNYIIEVGTFEALNNYTLKTGYIAYLINNCENLRSCYNENTYEYSGNNYILSGTQIPFNTIENYRFFRISTSNDPFAYALVGSCVIRSIEDTIVESYEDSYSDLFVLESQSLRQLKKDDLIGKDIIEVYTKNDESYNFPTFGGVYEDKDNAYYVTLSDKGTEDISDGNATTYDGVVAPKQDSSTFRQIENVYINATES